MFELVLMIAVGCFFIFLGWRIWKKEQITLIHDYHYTKVAQTDKKPYTEKMGKAMILMGAGMLLTGILDFVSHTAYGWVAFGVCFATGLIMMISAQIKYNHGIF
ncbi:MAG: hypothetical protein PWQ08_1261 [Clostridiales bacterium]|nr:DUF3784 domain-containing protein [Pygmaiobacter sp.]MDK2814006.1 hypothetical protein [Clostridiales bacterium]